MLISHWINDEKEENIDTRLYTTSEELNDVIVMQKFNEYFNNAVKQDETIQNRIYK